MSDLETKLKVETQMALGQRNPKPLPLKEDKFSKLKKLVDTTHRENVTNTEEHTYVIKSQDPKVNALFNLWGFIDLLSFKGGSESFGELHQEMVQFNTTPQLFDLNKNRRRLNLVPRGHLKSTLNTVLYCLWRIYRNPDIRICVATATKDLADSFIREIKQYFEDEDLQERVWNTRPHHQGRLIPILDKAGFSRRNQRWDLGLTEALDKKIVWRANALQVMRPTLYKEPTIMAASPGSNITGLHFDLMILDDIINEDSVATPEKIEKTLNWTQDLESIIDPKRSVSIGKIGDYVIKEVIGDEMVLNGTRYARNDLYDYIQQNAEFLDYQVFRRSIYKNDFDDADGFIWDKFTPEHVESLKKRKGYLNFAKQYLNQVVASELLVLDRDNMKFFKPEDIETHHKGFLRIPVPNDDKKAVDWVDVRPILCIDPAISQKKKADNTVILVGGMDFARNLYVIDFKCGKYLPNVTIDMTYALADKWKLTHIHVEVVSFQQALVYMFRQTFNDRRPLAITEYRPKGDKKARIETNLHPLFDAGKVYFAKWMSTHNELLEEMAYFPSETVHDDILDAMSMVYEVATPTHMRKGSVNYNTYDRNFTVNSRYGGRLR